MARRGAYIYRARQLAAPPHFGGARAAARRMPGCRSCAAVQGRGEKAGSAAAVPGWHEGCVASPRMSMASLESRLGGSARRRPSEHSAHTSAIPAAIAEWCNAFAIDRTPRLVVRHLRLRGAREGCVQVHLIADVQERQIEIWEEQADVLSALTAALARLAVRLGAIRHVDAAA